MTPQRKFKQNTLAIVYDFDGTLTPKPMQEYTVFTELNVSAKKFWDEVRQEAKRLEACQILTYMRILLEKMEINRAHLTRKKLRNLAKDIEYFPGVETWFNRINEYVKQQSSGSVKIRHYIISAGLKEILNGIKIKRFFHRIYASEYFFDHHEVAKFPTTVINDTIKTQYLFRINKGRENMSESINEYMPEQNRPIPFSNILYIGDGLTDVPCMTVTKNNGGHSIAVYQPSSTKSLSICKELAKAKRIDYYASGDYSEGKKLERRVKVVLNLIISKIALEREKHIFQNELI
jgi:2-hydroxy-3-keto-5-methylthiopentenyl-1-phosphate phosphatase